MPNICSILDKINKKTDIPTYILVDEDLKPSGLINEMQDEKSYKILLDIIKNNDEMKFRTKGKRIFISKDPIKIDILQNNYKNKKLKHGEIGKQLGFPTEQIKNYSSNSTAPISDINYAIMNFKEEDFRSKTHILHYPPNYSLKPKLNNILNIIEEKEKTIRVVKNRCGLSFLKKFEKIYLRKTSNLYKKSKKEQRNNLLNLKNSDYEEICSKLDKIYDKYY